MSQGLDQVELRKAEQLSEQQRADRLDDRRELEGGPAGQEKCKGRGHHYHLVCTACGSVRPLHYPDLEGILENLADQRGFHPLRYNLEVFGQCPSCLANRLPGLPLSLTTPGERVRVERLGGAQEMVSRLHGMGLTAGAELEIISAKNGGALVVALGNSRLALGRKAAQNILVSPLG